MVSKETEGFRQMCKIQGSKSVPGSGALKIISMLPEFEIKRKGSVSREHKIPIFWRYGEHLISLEDPFKYHNENYFSKLKNNTSRLYITSQNYIRRFVKKVYKRSDFYLTELDYSFVIKFENYLRSFRPRLY